MIRKRTAAAVLATALIGTAVLAAPNTPSTTQTKGMTVVDPWTGPTPVSNQFPKNEPDGIRKLLDKIKAVELQVKESTSNLLGTAGIRLSRLGMFIDSSLTVGGDLAATGNTTIGGNAAITGTLSLPSGIIDNAALNSPVAPAVGHADGYNFPLTPAWSTVAQITASVPEGYTRALVIATGNASCKNPTAAQDYLWASVGIGPGTSPGYAMRSAIVAADYGSATNSSTRLLTGLTGGGTFAVYLDLSTDIANWSASTFNSANLDAAITFMRG